MIDLKKVAVDLSSAREKQRAITAVAKEAALVALDNGMSEVEVARELGVTRMTVRKWQGKDQDKKR